MMGDEDDPLLYCVECEEEAASLDDEGLCPECAEPTVKKVHRLALDYQSRWAELIDRCGKYATIRSVARVDKEVEAMLAIVGKVEEELGEAVGEDGDDYVFAHGNDAVILVGSGEDGVYVVERPLLRMDR